MATTPQATSRSPTIRRILREAAEITNSPSPDYTAEPLEADLFEWHFTIRGPPNSPYARGLYHGRIVLPPTYPLRPPSFRFTTPNGRFEANREICLSISGHHEETWQPAWGIRTAIVALRSFMITDAKGQLGGYDATEAVRLRLASESSSFKCPTCAKTNRKIITESEERAKEINAPIEQVQVPDELSMAFKDQLNAMPKAISEEEDAETAELAEGFVPTVPAAHSTTTSANPLVNDSVRPRPRPSQTVPQPTRTIPATTAQQQHHRRPTDEGVPVWIDRVIVVLVMLLAALVLKVLFGV